MSRINRKAYDKWAHVYDIIYSQYKPDINYYIKKAVQTKGPVLEIGCGTGRIYLEALKRKADITGFDISPKMLKVLKNKASKLGLKPKVSCQDMKKFRYKKKFKLIIIPFRAFLHNITIQDQIDTLR